MEKRRSQRITSKRLLANISDGLGFYTGIVTNFSRTGISIEDVPVRLEEKSQNVSVVLESANSNFKLKTKPRWSEQNSISKVLGLEIVNATWGWAEFVMENEKRPEKTTSEITI